MALRMSAMGIGGFTRTGFLALARLPRRAEASKASSKKVKTPAGPGGTRRRKTRRKNRVPLASIPETPDPDVCYGLQLLKNEEEIRFRPWDAYPSWLWDLEKPDPTLEELLRMDPDSMPLHLWRRLLKLSNRERIRSNNNQRKKP